MISFAPLRVAACCLSLLLAMNAVAQTKGLRRSARKALKAGEQASSQAAKNMRTAARQAELTAKVAPAVKAAQINRIKHHKYPSPPWNPETKIQELLKIQPNPSLLLPNIWELQNQYGNRNMFGLLALRFYVQEFGLLTPHLNKLFKHVAHLNDKGVETRFIARLRFFAQNQKHILREISSRPLPQDNIRIRYTEDVDKLTVQNFNAHKLVLSVEQRMNPAEDKDFPVRHVNARSVFETPGGQFAVYQYAGPIDLTPNLYRYLINNTDKRAPFTIVFDEEAKSLAMYNEDKTLWLRITPHEYENPKKLHIHLNEQRTVTFTDATGRTRKETVNVNLSIPLLPPDNLPSHPQAAQQFLYDKLVLLPVKNFQGNRRVTIERRAIF